MSDPFYLTEPYREARRKAEADLADWHGSYPNDLTQDQIDYCYEIANATRERWTEERRERNFVMFCICAGLAVAIVILYFGTYSYVRTNPPSSSVVHQSSGL